MKTFSETLRKTRGPQRDLCCLHQRDVTEILAHKHRTKALAGQRPLVTQADWAQAGQYCLWSQALWGWEMKGLEQFSLSFSYPASTRSTESGENNNKQPSPLHLTPALHALQSSNSKKATKIDGGSWVSFWKVTAMSWLVCSLTSRSSYQQSRKRQNSLCWNTATILSESGWRSRPFCKQLVI